MKETIPLTNSNSSTQVSESSALILYEPNPFIQNNHRFQKAIYKKNNNENLTDRKILETDLVHSNENLINNDRNFNDIENKYSIKAPNKAKISDEYKAKSDSVFPFPLLHKTSITEERLIISTYPSGDSSNFIQIEDEEITSPTKNRTVQNSEIILNKQNILKETPEISQLDLSNENRIQSLETSTVSRFFDKNPISINGENTLILKSEAVDESKLDDLNDKLNKEIGEKNRSLIQIACLENQMSAYKMEISILKKSLEISEARHKSEIDRISMANSLKRKSSFSSSSEGENTKYKPFEHYINHTVISSDSEAINSILEGNVPEVCKEVEESNKDLEPGIHVNKNETSPFCVEFDSLDKTTFYVGLSGCKIKYFNVNSYYSDVNIGAHEETRDTKNENLYDLLVTNCPESSKIGYSPIHSISAVRFDYTSENSKNSLLVQKFLIASNFDWVFTISLQEDSSHNLQENLNGCVETSNNNNIDTTDSIPSCNKRPGLSREENKLPGHLSKQFLVQAPKNTQIYSMSYDEISNIMLVSFRVIKANVAVDKRNSENNQQNPTISKIKKVNSEIVANSICDISETPTESIHVAYSLEFEGGVLQLKEIASKEIYIETNVNSGQGSNPLSGGLVIGTNKSKIFTLNKNLANGVQGENLVMCAVYIKYNNSICIFQLNHDFSLIKSIDVDKNDKVLDFGVKELRPESSGGLKSEFEFYILTSSDILTHTIDYIKTA
ncbi:hypothetical protein AYI69_g5961 [Smittium culicis]|uniref:Uncharacterized protein n=1 Tax=Smittium culicis TaxID=133412 RepID=A0A1R1Y2X9_9FUNG|nr:hypothetical protein AYI69_g5961 [Smittium culicis]